MNKKIIILLTVILFLSSCRTMFTLVTNDYSRKGNKIAVIACEKSGINVEYASHLDVQIANMTKFTVVPQSRVKKMVRDYPYNIQGPYKGMVERRVSYPSSNIAELVSIGKRLKVDYVYAVWMPGGTVTNGHFYQLETYTQMIDVSDGKEIGRGSYEVMWHDTFPYYQTKDDGLRIAAKFAAKGIGTKMNMNKNN